MTFFKTIRLRKICLVLATMMLLVPASQGKPIRMKIATISPDGLSWMKQLRVAVKEIETKTEGRVKFKIYPGGVQGDDYVVLRKMNIGQLQGGGFAAGSLTRFYPDLQVYNLPLQFQSFAEVDYVRKRMDQRINKGLEAGGLTSFGLTETGFAYLLSKEPVTTVVDLKKLKAWVPTGDFISADLIKSFGISPIPLHITDVLAGLQTGLINAVVVPPLVALALQWHNHVEYMMNLPLLYIYSIMAVDNEAFAKIAEPDQQIVIQVMNELSSNIDAENRIDNRKAYAALITQGISVTTPGPEDVPAWQDLAGKSIARLVESGKITSESLEIYNEFLNEFRHQVSSQARAPGE